MIATERGQGKSRTEGKQAFVQPILYLTRSVNEMGCCLIHLIIDPQRKIVIPKEERKNRMKAVVTGGVGFIGSHLVEALIALQFEVHIFDNLISGKKKYVHPQAIFHMADISSEQVKSLIADIHPDVVLHLAAQADVQRSIQNPGYDAMVKLVATIYLLEACRDAAVSKFIFASTSAVYGNLQKEQIVETDPTSPISYYGISKYSAESYIRVVPPTIRTALHYSSLWKCILPQTNA